MDRSIIKDIKDLDILIGKNLIVKKDQARENLNHTQMQIIFYLLKNKDKEVCQKDLQDETHLKKASITGTLDSLQDKGIIKRIPSKTDKRKNIIILSDEVLQVEEKFRNRFVLFEETIINNISEAELNCFHNVVDKIKENIEKKGI